ncbi:MAG TPA: hypothetical protein VF669_15575 [Tepidisphaeraceae bacterium]|jgi:hypothetical protein
MQLVRDEEDILPRIDLRIPAPWHEPGALIAALLKQQTGYELTEHDFRHIGTGNTFDWGVSGPDDGMAELFMSGRGYTEEEIEAIRKHRLKFHLIGPGGSVAAAKAILHAACALCAAGGLGILVDNSGVTHVASEVNRMSEDSSLDVLFFAFINVVHGREAMFSHGMHCFGLRDAELPFPPDREISSRILINLLMYTLESDTPVLDGDPLGDEDGPLFEVHHQPCTRVPASSPFHNPYGVWRIEPIEKESLEEDSPET